MNNAAMAYNDLAIKKAPKDKLIKLFGEIDAGICKALNQKGYSNKEIEDVLMKKSYGFKNTEPLSMGEYLDSKVFFAEEGKQHPAMPIGKAYELEREKFFDRFQQVLIDCDAEIFCDLKDRHFSMKNILDAFGKFSPIRYFIHDKESLAKYSGAVIDRSNSAHFKRLYKDIESASSLYRQLLRNQLGKHKGYTLENLSHVREGSIVLSMMMEHDVPVDIIGQVLERNSTLAAAEGHDYTEKIMHRLKYIREAYEKIAKAGDVEQAASFSELYYSAAREYMKRTGTRLLCARDDEQILGELMKRNLKKEQIVSVLAASPVALEIGRQLHEYVKNLSAFFQTHYENIKSLSMEEIRDKASKRLEYYGKYFQLDIAEANHSKDTRLIHTLVCRDLLTSECNPDLIKPALEKLIKVPKGQDGYLEELIAKASEAVKAEQNIKSFAFHAGRELTPDKVKELEISPPELFMLVAKAKIKDNPSFIRRWSYSAELDADIMETVMTKYPDTDLKKLQEALLENSPKALMADDKEAYAEEVMGKLNRRVELNKIGQEIIESKQDEYTKQCGLAVEGTSRDNYMNSYVDGKFAVKLLQDGKTPLEVRNAILMVAEPKGVSPAEYADNIIKRAVRVTDRLKKITAHVPVKASVGVAVALGALYLDYISDQYSMKGFVQSKMDIDAFYMMQQRGGKPEEIKEVIREYSPVYVEPGRNDEYLDYVESNAMERLQEEQQKLEYYKAVARENHEDYLTEYAKHQTDLQRNIDLAYSETMDEIIAEAMMIQGFSDDEIAKALDNSPVKADADYSNKIIEKTRDKMVDKEVTVSMDMKIINPAMEVSQKIVTTTAKSQELIREMVRKHDSDE